MTLLSLDRVMYLTITNDVRLFVSSSSVNNANCVHVSFQLLNKDDVSLPSDGDAYNINCIKSVYKMHPEVPVRVGE